MAVPMCWPISARMMFTVTMPSRSRLYQIVGSKGLDPNSCAAPCPRRETERDGRAGHADQKGAARKRALMLRAYSSAGNLP